MPSDNGVQFNPRTRLQSRGWCPAISGSVGLVSGIPSTLILVTILLSMGMAKQCCWYICKCGCFKHQLGGVVQRSLRLYLPLARPLLPYDMYQMWMKIAGLRLESGLDETSTSGSVFQHLVLSDVFPPGLLHLPLSCNGRLHAANQRCLRHKNSGTETDKTETNLAFPPHRQRTWGRKGGLKTKWQLGYVSFFIRIIKTLKIFIIVLHFQCFIIRPLHVRMHNAQTRSILSDLQ